MSSYFEQQGIKDRPLIDVTLKIGGQEVPVKVRKAAASESDMMDAFFAGEHARARADIEKSSNGLMSEKDSIRSRYAALPRAAVTDQLLGTRGKDILDKAVTILGIDFADEDVKMNEMTPEDKAAYEAQMQERLDKAREQAKAEIRAEYDAMSLDEVLDKVTEINVAIQALARANRALYSYFLFYCLYQPDGTTRCFENPNQVKQEFTADTIESVTLQIRKALEESSKVPTTSPEASEQSGPSSSQSNSEEGTTVSGEPTTTTSSDSSQSTNS